MNINLRCHLLVVIPLSRTLRTYVRTYILTIFPLDVTAQTRCVARPSASTVSLSMRRLLACPSARCLNCSAFRFQTCRAVIATDKAMDNAGGENGMAR